MNVISDKYNISCPNPRFVEEVFESKEYDFMNKNKVIIDIGANIGMFSLYAYDFAKVIYAIEPVKDEWEHLIKNVEGNHLENIKPFKLAIYDKNGKINITSGGDTGAGAFTTDLSKGHEEVECKTLASFILENEIEHIDIVKIDVEGAEFAIFSADDFGSIADRIDIIVGEIHGSYDDLSRILSPYFTLEVVENRHFLARRTHVKKA